MLFCNLVVLDVGCIILYYAVIGLVGFVLYRRGYDLWGWVCKVDLCEEVWRAMVRVIVLCGVRCANVGWD